MSFFLSIYLMTCLTAKVDRTLNSLTVIGVLQESQWVREGLHYLRIKKFLCDWRLTEGANIPFNHIWVCFSIPVQILHPENSKVSLLLPLELIFTLSSTEYQIKSLLSNGLLRICQHRQKKVRAMAEKYICLNRLPCPCFYLRSLFFYC